MENNCNFIFQFSSHLFWDVKPELLEAESSKKFIIKRVLEYGLWEDWLLLKKLYGLENITNVTQGFRELDPKTLAFISQISGVPKEKFRCYTTKQLIPLHWNF
jgi:hypothetical protein